MKNKIIIQDWAGNVLFEGSYKSKEVDAVLDANRCDCEGEIEDCSICDGSGFEGDFEVMWADESDERNVYEYINY